MSAPLPPRAGILRRTAALMLDAVVVSALVSLAAILFHERTRLIDLTAAAVLLAYILWETIWAGSLGKMALDLAIVAADGSPASWRQRAARAALKSGPWAVAFAAAEGPLESAMITLGVLMTLSQALILGPSRRTLHDRLTGTAVARPEDADEERVDLGARERRREAPVGSPWLAMWIRPRRTIQHVLATGGGSRAVWLAMLAGVTIVFRVVTLTLARQPTPIAAAVLIGPPLGLLLLYTFGLTLTWGGALYGGRTEARRTRWAVGWSTIPCIWTLPLWLLEYAIFGSGFVFRPRPRAVLSEVAAVVIGLVLIVVPPWQLTVTVACVAEVQRLPRDYKGIFGPALGLFLGSLVLFLAAALLMLILAAVLWTSDSVDYVVGFLLWLLGRFVSRSP